METRGVAVMEGKIHWTVDKGMSVPRAMDIQASQYWILFLSHVNTVMY
jgi:hypothetical protein